MNGLRPMDKESAEALAIAGLARLAGDDTMLNRFSAITGILPNDMRAAAADPGFLVGVLDFYLSHEPDLTAWAQTDGFAPEDVMRARVGLDPRDVAGLE